MLSRSTSTRKIRSRPYFEVPAARGWCATSISPMRPPRPPGPPRPIGRHQPLHHVPGAVGAAVVHEDDLVVAPERLEGRREARVERLEIVPLVHDGQDDGDGLAARDHALLL